jgi:hypothetical protein
MKLWILGLLILSACASAAEPPVDCRQRCTELKADSYAASWEIGDKPSCSCIFKIAKAPLTKGGRAK